MKDLYLPFEDRKIDFQYKSAISTILNEGIESEAPSGVNTITYTGIQMRFWVENGCPLITERDMAPVRKKNPTIWRQAIAELTAFINGARTHEEIAKFGCHWWKLFLTPEKAERRGLEPGDNGPGSYGAAFHDFPDVGSETIGFNQFEHLLRQMKEFPYLKTHLVTPWVPQYVFRHSGMTQKVVICPCHGWIQFMIFGDKLIMHMTQRSGDFPIGVPSNMVQYFAILLAVADYLDLIPYQYIHYVINAHIYVDQIEQAKAILAKEIRPFPKLVLNKKVKNLFALRHTDFDLSEYYPNEEMSFPVTV